MPYVKLLIIILIYLFSCFSRYISNWHNQDTTSSSGANHRCQTHWVEVPWNAPCPTQDSLWGRILCTILWVSENVWMVYEAIASLQCSFFQLLDVVMEKITWNLPDVRHCVMSVLFHPFSLSALLLFIMNLNICKRKFLVLSHDRMNKNSCIPQFIFVPWTMSLVFASVWSPFRSSINSF